MKIRAAALALLGPATTALGYVMRDPPATCLTRAEAREMVDVYQQLIGNYTAALCERYCADGFRDVSDSINTFLLQPLGAPTFATKQAFMEAQQYNPAFPVEVLSVDAVDCDVIALQWRAAFGAAMVSSKGITVLRATREKGWWQIGEIWNG